MRFDMKHLLMAVIIAGGYYIFGALLSYVGYNHLGSFFIVLLKYGWVLGGLVYAFRDVHHVGEAFLDGLLYVLIFLIGAIVVNFASWGASILTPVTAGAVNLGVQGGNWNTLLMWPVIWGEFAGILLFTTILGFVNTTKKHK